MLMVSQLIGFGAGGSSPATVTFTDSSVDVSDATTYTFSSQSLGSGTKKTVVGINGNGTAGRTVSSVTIGGVSASLVKATTDASGERVCEIWQLDGVSATTGDIVVTFTAGLQRCGIGVWAVTGAQASAQATANSSANPPSTTINVPAGGIAIATSSGGSSSTTAWTGLTENYDETVESSTNHSGASDAFATAQTGLTVTADTTPDGSQWALAVASWGPA